MTYRILTRTGQVAVNAPDASTAFDFTGAAVSLLAFSFTSRSISTGDTLAYYADNGTGQWERGLGTWNDTAKTLTRTTVRESSTGSAIVWTSAPTVWSDGGHVEDPLPSLVVGGATDNFTIASDGTFTLNGAATVFRDELGDITKLKVAGTGISESLTEGTMGLMTSCDYANDYLVANFQFNHDRKHGAPVYPHVHWFQTQDNTPNFLFQYRWQLNGTAKTTAWTNLRMLTNAFTYVSGTLNQITYSAGITPPSGDNVSTILQVRFTRDKTNASTAFTGSDTHTATADITSLDIHIEVDAAGSSTEYSK
jgi:hypothetical protein